MVPIVFYTKPHLAEYIKNKLPNGRADRSTVEGAYLLELMERGHGKKQCELHTSTFTKEVKLFVSLRQIQTYGNSRHRYKGSLTAQQVQEYNRFISMVMRREFRASILTYLALDKCIVRAINHARTITGISETLYTDDAVRKDFMRYRAKHDAPFIYRKKNRNPTHTVLL